MLLSRALLAFGALACQPTPICSPTIASPRLPPTKSEARPSIVTPVTTPRNVILLLSDGTAPEAWTLARWVSGRPLHVDSILAGAIRTYGADSVITDSAPGATAYATTKKGSDKGIAVGAWNHTIDAATVDPKLAYVPLVTLLEGAKTMGYATGLVATSSIQHATPAAFSAHVPDRNQYNEIAEQQVYQDMDVVLGGGEQYLRPTSTPGGHRTDDEDLTAILRQKGYRFVTTQSELLQSCTGRTWGAFAANEMAYEIDRPRFAPKEPSLAEMTECALGNLAQSKPGSEKGFFLFVEGSKVDWGAHVNDPVAVVHDLLAFDTAVGKSLEFARTHSNTQVIVVADHGTGGLSIGTESDSNYSQTDDDAVVMPIRRAKSSAERLVTMLGMHPTDSQLVEIISREWNLKLSHAELRAVRHALSDKSRAQIVLGRILSRRARVGWTTNGHTGADVMMFAYGPQHPTGLLQNTEVGAGIAQFLELDLARLQAQLFLEATSTLTALGYSVSLDRADPENGQVVVEKGGRRATLPWAKNLLQIEQRTIPLGGVVVFAERLQQVFIPRDAVDWLLRTMP